MADNAELENLLRESIEAQNRTTHAVRAIAGYILIQTTWGALGGAAIGGAFGNRSYYGEPDSGLMTFGFILICVGLIHGLIYGANELSQSKYWVKKPGVSTQETHPKSENE